MMGSCYEQLLGLEELQLFSLGSEMLCFERQAVSNASDSFLAYTILTELLCAI